MMLSALSVSVVINVSYYSDALYLCLNSVLSQDYSHIEVIVIDSSGAEDEMQMLKTAYPSVILLRQPSHIGFAAGKNIGVHAAKGKICIFISDTSEFTDTEAVQRAVAYFANDNGLGCLSMRVVDKNDDVIMKFVPRRDRKIISEETPGANFIAAASAVRRSAFLKAGGLWEVLDPHFGGEPEFSYRLLDTGYHILHTPHIAVRCHEVRQQRKASRRLYSGTRNTPWIALRNLPWYSVVGLTFFSWGYFFLIASRDRQLPLFFKAISDSIEYWPAIYRLRKPVNSQAVATIWRHSGLIFY